jgi:DHA2 family methylenomycin A resistance protein-like MFS transporter
VQATPADRSGLATGVSNTARQTGTASGVAVYGAVAGSPAAAASFVAGMHVLAVASTVLWAGALTLAATGIASRRNARAREHAELAR